MRQLPDMRQQNFLGKEALQLQKQQGLSPWLSRHAHLLCFATCVRRMLRCAGVKKRMLQFTMDDPDVSLWHNEAVFMDGKCVGLVTSGGLGHTVNNGAPRTLHSVALPTFSFFFHIVA